MNTADLHLMIGDINSKVTLLVDSYPLIDKRLSKLERKNSWLTGALSVIALAVAAKIGVPEWAVSFLH